MEPGTDEFRDARIELARIAHIFVENNIQDRDLIALLDAKMLQLSFRGYDTFKRVRQYHTENGDK